jgi:hypothetical protein
MLMRPVRRVGRPGLVGTVARTAVVAGTATAVVGGVSKHQASKAAASADAQAQAQAQQEAQMQAMAQQAAADQLAAQQAAQAQAAPPPPAPAESEDDVLSQLERLGKLKDQGILTDEEFQAQKSKLLGL